MTGSANSPDQERPASPPGPEVWSFRLYVAGGAPMSAAASDNLKRLCEGYLTGRYRIEVVDVLENPQLAEDEHIVAVPTVVRERPEPRRRLVGDLRDTERALKVLQLQSPGA